MPSLDGPAPTTYEWDKERGLRADVYRPSFAGRAPLLLLFHAGYFLRYDRTRVRQQALHFRARGYVVCAPDYRKLDDPSVTLNDAIDDAFRVLKWAAVHATEWAADPARTIVAGNSAGGLLAAMLHLKARSKAYRICGAVLNYPATDVVRFAEEGFETAQNPLWRQFDFGPRGMFGPRANVDTDRALYEAASPKYSLRKDDADLAPVLAFVGADDVVIPPSEVEAYMRELRAAGASATLHVVPHEGHDFLRSAPDYDERHRQTLRATMRFMDAHVKPSTLASRLLRGSIVAGALALVVFLVGVKVHAWRTAGTRGVLALCFVGGAAGVLAAPLFGSGGG